MNVEQFLALGLVLTGAIALAIYGLRYRDKAPRVCQVPVFPALSGEVGRAAEAGISIHIALGNGGLISEDALASVAALQGLRALLDLAATYDTPPIITTADPTLYLLANDWLRRAYTRIGNVGLFRSDAVRFTAASPTLYAAMAATHLFDAGIGANIMLGTFGQEVNLLTESAQRRGINTMGGTVTPLGLGALYPALDTEHLVLGEELFAGAALVKDRSSYWASLSTQNLLRWLVVVGIVTMAGLSFVK